MWASASACSPPNEGALDTAPSLVLSPCQLSAPGTSDRRAARCGDLAVPEDRSDPKGATISLHIAVVPAVRDRAEADPVFLLAGGPGQAATEAFPPLLSAFGRANERRDLVLVDQRGTGRSNALACPAEGVGDLSTVDRDVLQTWARACLEHVTADVRQYTTEQTIADLEDARRALGYERINLYGASYGTRVALEYLRRHPRQLRSVVLDGIVAPEVALGATAARDAQAALDAWLRLCDADPDCHRAFPEVANDIDSVLSQLDGETVSVQVDHPVTGVPTVVSVTRPVAVGVIRFLTYSPATATLIPLVMHQAAEGDLRRLAAQYLIIEGQTTDALSLGLHYAVTCAEDVPFFDASDLARDNAGTYLADLASDGMAAVCAVWPNAAVPPDLKAPVRSDVPVLLLSGELDPVTPPENGASVLEGLPRGRHIVAPGLGHGTVLDDCIASLVADFLEAGSATELDEACTQHMSYEPFFVGFSGPVPPPDAVRDGGG